MKLVQQSRTAQKPAHRRNGPAPARKAARGRPYGLNHLAIGPVNNSFESQAEQAASRLARGEQNIARGLGSAPAASVDVPSVGSPLGVAERLRLERGFGADLEAVRIHSDGPAATAARAEHARAFVAGRDIFFDQNCYDPRSADGFNLLAHEVAHVLQQTGREGPDRRLRVHADGGTGPIQLAPAHDAARRSRRQHVEEPPAAAAHGGAVAQPAHLPPITAGPRRHDAKPYGEGRAPAALLVIAPDPTLVRQRRDARPDGQKTEHEAEARSHRRR
jgi:hypothetical protein